ncbi:MAG TPA: hypothetical protein H9909_10495 [Candidatus Mediterraneibacter norfolkensis]|nr:hypothetical protein [Candidatus Mediterraneibacter norfolkensis]
MIISKGTIVNRKKTKYNVREQFSPQGWERLMMSKTAAEAAVSTKCGFTNGVG